MKQHFKFMILIIFVITILLKPLKADASAPALPINPGVSPSILSEAEFTTWIYTLFGIRSHNTKLIDNTNFDEQLSVELAKYNIDYDELIAEMYGGYVKSPYKVTIPRTKFNDMANALAGVFALSNSINVNVISEDGEGKFSSDGIIEQLNTIKNTENFIQLKNYSEWNNFWSNSTITDNIGSVIVFFEPWQDWATVTNIYISYDTPIIKNGNDYTFTYGGKYFGANSYNDFSRMSLNIGDLQAGRTITIDSQYFDVIELEKSQIIQGTVSINPAILELIKEGAYSLVTPYSMDITSDSIAIPIPKDVPTILDRVTAGEISATQAIEEAQAVPVDTTDNQAIADAQSMVFSPSPEFQTYGLGDLFPFCIPFDIYHILTSFVDPPKTPEFDIQLPNGGHDQQGNITFYTQHVSFEQFNGIASLARTLELVIFGIGLAVITRSFIMRA